MGEVIVFFATFAVMEFNAWALHKFVMHGPGWFLHYDHHNPTGRKFQRNDFFAFVFAAPSFLMILFGWLLSLSILSSVGYGIMAYGICYFIVHEEIIHRRWGIFDKAGFFSPKGNFYFEALNWAHKIHHAKRTKEDNENFGMLFVPLKHIRQAYLRRHKL